MVAALGWGQGAAAEAPVFPGAQWATASPTVRARWSDVGLKAARAYFDSLHSSSVMIVQHGVVIEQWGPVEKKISSYSVRKSLISVLYGIYAAEHVIDTETTLEQLGVDDSPEALTPGERQAKVVDLLRARSGVFHAVDFETKAQIAERPARGSHPPGTFWSYNNWDFNALGTIFEKATGRPMGVTFDERVGKPIGMQDFQASDVYYLAGPFHPSRVSLRDLRARPGARRPPVPQSGELGRAADRAG